MDSNLPSANPTSAIPAPSGERPRVGIIGAGSFGTAMANRLIVKNEVWLHARDEPSLQELYGQQHAAPPTLSPEVVLLREFKTLLAHCEFIFVLLPSQAFRSVLREIAPLFEPHHRIIHGTKGLDIDWPEDLARTPLTRAHIHTMSEVLQQEVPNTPFAAMAGPNIAHQLNEGHPAATVLASADATLLEKGRELLQTDTFQVYFNDDVFGLELCGVLKNTIAIAAGCLRGLGYADNTRGLLINRGLVEMATLGEAMGATLSPFLGLAGMGDLIATCTSSDSRNHTLGYHLAQGNTRDEALQLMGDTTVEGIRTTEVFYHLAQHYKWEAPITRTIYQVLFDNLAPAQALHLLMCTPCTTDADFQHKEEV